LLKQGELLTIQYGFIKAMDKLPTERCDCSMKTWHSSSNETAMGMALQAATCRYVKILFQIGIVWRNDSLEVYRK